MTPLSLDGTWELHRKDAPGETFPAPVPGCVHDALLQAGKIPSPFFRYDERASQWVGEADWVYERSFEVSADYLREESIWLVSEGLDTFATVFLNGEQVGQTDNMFRTHRWDVRALLRVGGNHLRVEFASVIPYMRRKTEERLLPAWNEPSAGHWWGVNGRGYVRKQACQFGWDWGPMCVSAGIWQTMRLEAWSRARIEDWQVRQEHAEGAVRLVVSTAVEAARPEGLRLKVSASCGEEVAAQEKELSGREGSGELLIENPRLWWPNGLGEQPLYRLEIWLEDERGAELDRVSRRIGLRRLELIREPDAFGTSFVFAANGVRFFAKGSNWIPLDQYPSSQNLGRYEPLLRSAAEAHMNMMRVWGGGYYSHDAFYDLCDELGICVWQDMMFGCGAYPTWDQAFLDNVHAETLDNVRRLRHRASLALWCGNNELEMGFVAEEWSSAKMSWDSYRQLFEQVIPAALAQADPLTPYIPGSPHSSGAERETHDSPLSGDLHLWEIWFAHSPFEAYRKYPHRFVSEFGFQSFPEPRTVASFTRPAERRINSPVMEYHERSQPGVGMILYQLMDWFTLPESFDDTLFLSQLTQAIGLKTGIEHWRRNWPQTSGATYWQLNDCWPAPTWSSIDVHGRWKALHYFAKRFFAPVLISGLENAAAGTVEAHANNDHPHPVAGSFVATVTDAAGQTLLTHRQEVVLPPLSAQSLHVLELRTLLEKHGKENLLVWLEWTQPDGGNSANLVLFARPKTLLLEPPGLRFAVAADGESFAVEVRADKAALWVWLELDGADCRFSDNFFPLRPDAPRTVMARPEAALSPEEFQARVRVRCVNET